MKKILLYSLVIVLLLPQISLAQGLGSAFGENSPLQEVQTKASFSNHSVGSIVGSIINNILSLVGLIFLLLMVSAGLLWMMSHGEEEKVKHAKAIIFRKLFFVSL